MQKIHTYILTSTEIAMLAMIRDQESGRVKRLCAKFKKKKREREERGERQSSREIEKQKFRDRDIQM
jgi:hypothetical protein